MNRVLLSAIKALERNLCDRCLGRQFARSGFGLSNKERGSSVKTTLALELESYGDSRIGIDESILNDLPVHHKSMIKESVVPDIEVGDNGDWKTTEAPSFNRPWEEDKESAEVCWLCNDIFDRVDELALLVDDVARELEFNTFLIGCRMDPQTVKREQFLWQEIEPPSPEPLKEELNREIGKKLFEIWTGKDVDKSEPDIAFIIDPLFRDVTMQIKPVFIFGRYRKMVRGIPQTRWPCGKCHGKGCDLCGGTGRRYKTSVEEIVGEYPRLILQGSDFKMHGMGREDVDVLCLGEGRPFIIEISRPKKREIDLSSMERAINDSEKGIVEVGSLRISSRKEIPHIKDGTTRKAYRVEIEVDENLDEQNLKYNISLLGKSPIKQRTPERVSHRRSDKVRTRKVHEAEVLEIHGNRAILSLTTDGGLYIKELMHGDGGRTDPSLSSLLGREIRVESLDVTGVLYEKDE